MNYADINNKINELAKSGLYNQDQLDAIKYGLYLPGLDTNLIMDPSIDSNSMFTYIKLARNKVDISNYVNNKWHLKGFSGEQLYYLVLYDSKGYDMSDLTPNMSIDDIKKNIDEKIHGKEKHDLLSNPSYAFLNDYNLDVTVLNFFVRKMEAGEDLSGLLRPGIDWFSFEQVKYLYSLYSIGMDITRVFNPNFTVEQMKQIVQGSKESIDFIQEIQSSFNARKGR